MQESQTNAKRKMLTYLFGIFLMFFIAALFSLIIDHPNEPWRFFKNISTMAVAFLGILLSYSFQKDKLSIRILKFTLGLIIIFVSYHFIKYLSILTLIFVYIGAFWAFSTDKIQIKFDDKKSLINEIEERKRLNNLKHDNENIASKSDSSKN